MLVSTFLDQLKARCAAKSDDEKQTLVLDLMSEDAKAGLDAAVAVRHQELIHSLQNLWDKYGVTLKELWQDRGSLYERFAACLPRLGY